MNLYEICMAVLERAVDGNVDFKDEMSRQNIANDIYDLFYEYELMCDVSINRDNINEYWTHIDDVYEAE